MTPSVVTISERDFTGQIRDVARMLGYLRYHAWLAKHSPAGFPDEVLVRGGASPRLIFAELKAERGRLSDEQALWLTRLAENEVEVYLWRPSMIDLIVDCLRAQERPPLADRQLYGSWA